MLFLFIKRQIIAVETKLNDQHRKLCKYMYLYLYPLRDGDKYFKKSHISIKHQKDRDLSLLFVYFH